jgi:hypothetical protein
MFSRWFVGQEELPVRFCNVFPKGITVGWTPFFCEEDEHKYLSLMTGWCNRCNVPAGYFFYPTMPFFVIVERRCFDIGPEF